MTRQWLSIASSFVHDTVFSNRIFRDRQSVSNFGIREPSTPTNACNGCWSTDFIEHAMQCNAKKKHVLWSKMPILPIRCFMLWTSWINSKSEFDEQFSLNKEHANCKHQSYALLHQRIRIPTTVIDSESVVIHNGKMDLGSLLLKYLESTKVFSMHLL